MSGSLYLVWETNASAEALVRGNLNNGRVKEETEHGGVRGDNFGPKGGAVKLDKVFMGEEKIREKKSFAFTRAGEEWR